MRKNRLSTAIGERMRQAATHAGLSAPQIAVGLGVSDTTVYRWWSGQRRAEEPVLERYAQLVGVPLPELYGERSPADEAAVVQRVLGVLTLGIERLLAGESLADATLDEMRKTSPPDADVVMPADLRRSIVAADDDIRAWAEARTKDWAVLDPVERRRRLELLARELLAAAERQEP